MTSSVMLTRHTTPEDLSFCIPERTGARQLEDAAWKDLSVPYALMHHEDYKETNAEAE